MSTSTTAKPKKKKKTSNAALIVAGVATAAVVGAGVYLIAGSASAKSPKKPDSRNGKSKGLGSASPPRTSKGGGSKPPAGTPGADAGGGNGAGTGGAAGPGGTIPSDGPGGSGKGTGGKSSNQDKPGNDKPKSEEDAARTDDPMGFWWGDRSKIPADFDYQSNQLWVSPDRKAAAAGFYFFMDGLDAAGDRVTWDEDGLSFLIADGSVLTPMKDRDHREDPVPSLRKILRKKDSETGKLRRDSVFSWIAAYYGTGISPLEAATSRGVGLLQDLVDEASVMSGGQKRPMKLNGPLRDFYGYALARLEMGRRAIYGDGFKWGEGEDAVG